MSKEKLMDRARDELFSHVNRCGVLQAAEDDQKHWMDETIEYLGERYPDLADSDLSQLYQIGIRFCKPAIAHGARGTAAPAADATVPGAVAPVVPGVEMVDAPMVDAPLVEADMADATVA